MVLQMISGVAAPTGRINATTAVLLPIGALGGQTHTAEIGYDFLDFLGRTCGGPGRVSGDGVTIEVMLEAEDGEQGLHSFVGQMIEQALEQHGAYAVGRGECRVTGRIGNVGSKKFEKI